MLADFKNKLKTGVFILGYSSISVQIIMLREFLTILGGNELVIGLFLSGWMLLTGIGALAGKWFKYRHHPRNYIIIPFIILVVSPVFSLILTYQLKSEYFAAGEILSPLTIWIFTLLVLLPFCFFSGFLFTVFSKILSSLSSKEKVRIVYGWESIGSLAGGIIYNFILVFFLNSLHALLISSFLGLLTITLLLFKRSIILNAWFATIIAIFILVFYVSSGKYQQLISNLYPGQKLMESKETPYGRVDVTSSGKNQISFYENGGLRYTYGAVKQSEEIVHFPMALHPDPDSVLIISGGFAGTILEALKYHPLFIKNIEINSSLDKLAWKHINVDFPKNIVSSSFIDGRSYVKKSDLKFDVIISDIPNPSTIKLNRYYTLEYFLEAKKIMQKHGIFCLQLESTGNYLDEESLRMHSILRNTLSKVFKNIILIPGTRNYFLASDTKLSFNISKNLDSLGIINQFITPEHINDQLMEMRSEMLLPVRYTSHETSSDLKPMVFKHNLKYWLRMHNTGIWLFLMIVSLITLIVWIANHPFNKGLLVTGFSGISAEFIAILIIQVLFGYSYYLTGIIITFFMAGIALGALYLQKLFYPSPMNFFKVQVLHSALLISMIAVFYIMNSFACNEHIAMVIILLMVILTGIFSGVIFSWTASLLKTTAIRIAANSYSADLTGSAAGVLITSVYLIPAFGIIGASALIAGLNLFNAFYVWLRTRN